MIIIVAVLLLSRFQHNLVSYTAAVDACGAGAVTDVLEVAPESETTSGLSLNLVFRLRVTD